MIPLLELGKKLVQHHNVDYLVSSARVPEIRSRGLINTNDASEATLNLVGLEDGLTVEQCNAVVPEWFRKRLEIIHAAYVLFMKSHSPDVVIADYFLHAAAKTTTDYRIPFYLFNSASAVSTRDIIVGKSGSELDHREERRLAMKAATAYATDVIVNSAREIDATVLPQILADPIMAGKSLRFIGPLFSGTEEPSKSVAFRAWMDAQESRSVVYVSFGTLAYPSPAQLFDLGKALLSLGKPFVVSLTAEQHSHFPEELQRSTALNDVKVEQKFLVLNWAPQKMILAHPALAVFLSHWGWNSTIEAMFWGVPVAGWPMFGDQFGNAEWFRGHGVGEVITTTGGSSTEVVPAEEIARVVRTVAQWDDAGGSTYQRKATEWKEVLRKAIGPDGSSTKDLQELMKFDQY